MADRTGGEMKVYEYFDGIYGEELIRRLSWKKEEGGVRITLDGKAVTPLLRDGESGASYDHMGMDTGNTSFAFSAGEIRAKTLIACGAMESSVLPAYHKAYLNGKVAYQGDGRFTVTDIKAGNQEAEETAAEAVRAQYGPQEISIVDYQYDMAVIEEGGLEIVAVVLQEGTDSYDYATVPMTVDEEGNWSAGEVLIEK